MRSERNPRRPGPRPGWETGESWLRTLHAIHEAAHAVVAWATGKVILRVTIISDGSSEAHTEFGPLPSNISLELPRHRALAEREVLIGLAGIMAERKSLGQKWHPDPSGSDLEHVGSIFSHASRSGVPLDRYLNRMAARVSVLLDLYWPRVKIIASALLRRGELAGKEVRELLK
jgi:hypothetical protein